ncbi:MAG TPA: GNAT family N-acetyltransferase [Candidatus Limiplasma sp.]|nr:GNAT family N-acetyltransferase [Candidatus Limiplasma sp.]
MAVIFRTYNPEPLFGEDYLALRHFLIQLDDSNYHFGRWDWMITHSHLDSSGLSKIGLWADHGEIVAAATYDCSLGGAYLPALPGYAYLWDEMLGYAETALVKGGKFAVLIRDGHLPLQGAAMRRGYIATQDREQEALFDLETGDFRYTLPEGFRVTSMRETYDLYRYGQVLWRGFNHEQDGEGPFVMNEHFAKEFERPGVNPDLKIAVVAPNGDFVSYCGMWQDAASQSALVEPVATDPAYRKLGLGRAAVLEGLRRCAQLGAKRAFVGSSQQFYYAIGFRPYQSNTWWARKPVVN